LHKTHWTPALAGTDVAFSVAGRAGPHHGHGGTHAGRSIAPHHLPINLNTWDANAPLPSFDNIRHFGGGQIQTSLDLKPGQHTLQLVLGDQNHIAHHSLVVSDSITSTVR
jgi:hypothetical protein